MQLELSFDPTLWVDLPAEFTSERQRDEWVAASVAQLESVRQADDSAIDLRSALDELGVLGNLGAGIALACLPDGETFAGIARISFIPSDGDLADSLERLTDGAGTALGTPDRAEVHSDILGSGWRIVRFAVLGELDSVVIMQVRYLWRIGSGDLLLAYDTPDPVVGGAMLPFLEQLADGVTFGVDDDLADYPIQHR